MSIEGGPIEPGRVLAGKYRVERVLGAGGMGVVVEATHVQLEERVAVKLLRPELLNRPGAAERVLREARATVKIASEHVVRVFDAGTLEGGVPYIAMEYLEGCDLAQLLCAEGKLSIDDACTYVLQACEGVARAHAIGIVHRDLKPANLFLAARGDALTLKVLDFGISKVLDPDSGRVDAGLTSTTALLGSPVYMSPEQLESTRDVDERTDLWSLGVILYELVTGAHPFVAETLPQLCRKITDQPAPPLRAARPDAPEELEAIVARCLAKKREERFPSVEALAGALKPLARAPGGKPGTDDVSPLAKTVRAAADAARSGERARAAAVTPVATGKPPRRWHTSIAAISALVVAAAGALAFGRSQETSPSAPAAPSAAVPDPLKAPTSVLACPPLQANGVEEPSGWLGAAAASLVCLRAQARMGGRTSRTLVPAELLDLPRSPADDFPRQPYDAPDARDRAVLAARSRSSAWFDGSVTRRARGVDVTLVLRAGADARELARAEGHGRALLEAVRAAMEPLERSGAIPSASDGDPFLLEWYRVRTADAAVASIDLATSTHVEDGDLLREDCKRFATRTDVLPDLANAAANQCTGTLQDPEPERSYPIDRASPGALRMSVVATTSAHERNDSAGVPEELEAALALTASTEGRAFLLASEAEILLVRGQNQRASECGLRSVDSDPKAVAGAATPWDTLLFENDAPSIPVAARAWLPWSTHALCFESMQSDDLEKRIRDARRVYVIAPSKLWALTLVEDLVAGGKREEARSVAAQAQVPGLRVLVEEGEAHFGKALAVMHDALPSFPASPSGGGEAFYMALQATAASLVLGRSPDYARELVARYLLPDPIPLRPGWINTYAGAVMCALAPASVARPCFARLRVLDAGPIAGAEGLREGAERYSEGDFAGAARAWRPMLRRPGWQLDGMRDLISPTLDRLGESELADKLDAPIVQKVGRFNGVELAHVRAALRAEKRGDRATARKLALQIIDAWSVADEEVPAVAEMRKLVARLK